MTEKTSLVAQGILDCNGGWGNKKVPYPIAQTTAPSEATIALA
jgi:hypothetical protein